MATAIVLSGGAAKGDFQVGALRYLYNQGIRPDIVCGTSVGAVNGVALALGEGGLEQLELIWAGLKENKDMYEEEPALWNNLSDTTKGILHGFISGGGGGGLSPDTIIGGAAAAAIAFDLPAIIVEAVIAKIASNTLQNDLQTIMNAPSIYDLQPVYDKLHNFLLPNWLTLDPASRKSLSVVLNKDDTLELFARWNDRSIQHLVQNSSGVWGSWESLGDPGRRFTSNIGVGIEQDGSQLIMVRADDKGFCDYWDEYDDWGASSRSSGWVFASGPVIAKNQDNTLEIFALGTDKGLYRRTEVTPNGGYGPWQSLGGIELTGDPTVGQNDDGRLEVFIKGGDHIVYHIWQIPGQKDIWSGWDGGLGAPNGQATSNIAVGRNSKGLMEIFVRGPDRALWHKRQTWANNGWEAAWQSLGGRVLSDPAVAQNQDGRLEVFVRGPNGELLHNWERTRGGDDWIGWFSLGEILSTGDPVVGRTHDQRLIVFVKGVDDSLWCNAQTAPNGGWGAWTYLGGSIWPGIRLRLATVSLFDGRLRYITESGYFWDNPWPTVDLEDAVMASSSIPAIFPAQNLLGEFFVDAGIREVLPIQMAKVEGADTIYAIAVAKNGVDLSAKPPTMMNNALRAAQEIMPDEIMHKDTNPVPMGWDPSVHIIQQSIDVHDAFTIRPGLISIATAYGFMRANDVIGPFQNQTTSQMLRDSTDQIISLRGKIWLMEITANGANFPSSGRALGGPDYDTRATAWTNVRTMKSLLKTLLNQRSTMGGALPDDAQSWLMNWENHDPDWYLPDFPLAPTPWDPVTLGTHNIPPGSP